MCCAKDMCSFLMQRRVLNLRRLRTTGEQGARMAWESRAYIVQQQQAIKQIQQARKPKQGNTQRASKARLGRRRPASQQAKQAKQAKQGRQGLASKQASQQACKESRARKQAASKPIKKKHPPASRAGQGISFSFARSHHLVLLDAGSCEDKCDPSASWRA